MARPKGTHSTRRRLLAVARLSEDLLTKLDQEIAAKGITPQMLRERNKLASTLIRALKGAEIVKHRRSPSRREQF